MFFSIKKSTIIILVIAVIISSVVCLSVASSVASTAAKQNGIVIVIDAGHGGMDGGVVGRKTKVKESEINLYIARALKNFLVNNGYEVVMTRDNMDGLYGLSTKNMKARDMQARKDIINKANPSLVVSIHQNSFPLASSRGAQVFYGATSSETSKKIAGSMQRVLNLNLPKSSRVEAKGDYFILQCSQFPSILVECGFLTNPEEEQLLITSAYQERVAYNIFCGINSEFTTTDKPLDKVKI